jgi:hypothetical protein
VQSDGAPTSRVLVAPPACETAHILIPSPNNNKNIPATRCVLFAPAKYIIIKATGIGVKLLYWKKNFLISIIF